MSTVISNWIKVLAAPRATVKALQREFGGHAESHPPNQVVLHFDRSIVTTAELTVSDIHNMESVVEVVLLTLTEKEAPILISLEHEFGSSEIVNEDRKKPAPYELVEFARYLAVVPQISIRARVQRPVGKKSRVVSVTLRRMQ